MTVWRWIGARVVFAVHDRQIAEHGGLDGIRDLGAVESTLARPQNLLAYGNPDAADLATAYSFGLARNHGFIDGNRRTAWIVARLFLMDNGTRIRFDPFQVIATMQAVAAGTLTEAGLAAWFRQSIVSPP